MQNYLKKTVKLFFENLYSLLLYKISGVVINGTDNIIISKFIGIIWVGIYSNYLLILNTLIYFIGLFVLFYYCKCWKFKCKQKIKIKNILFFECLTFVNFWIYGFCTVCLWNLINPFITLWLGEQLCV